MTSCRSLWWQSLPISSTLVHTRNPALYFCLDNDSFLLRDGTVATAQSRCAFSYGIMGFYVSRQLAGYEERRSGGFRINFGHREFLNEHPKHGTRAFFHSIQMGLSFHMLLVPDAEDKGSIFFLGLQNVYGVTFCMCRLGSRAATRHYLEASRRRPEDAVAC